MSRGFVKEYDDERLDEIPATMNALVRHLSNESGVRIFEKASRVAADTGKEIHEMSNGLSYTLNDEKRWYVID